MSVKVQYLVTELLQSERSGINIDLEIENLMDNGYTYEQAIKEVQSW